MKRIILMTILLAFPLVCFAQEATTQTSPQHVEQPLQLTINSDKDLYAIGDEVMINCKLENISDKAVNFYTAYRPEIDFQVICENKEVCPTADAPQTTGGTSLISLKPKEKLEYSINGKIIEGRGGLHISGSKIDAKYSEVSGIFIEVSGKGKVYLKEGYTKYDIKAYYRDGNWMAMPPASDYLVGNRAVYPPEVLEKFKDKWQGILASNTIAIEVVEKKCDSDKDCLNIDCSGYSILGVKEGYKPYCVNKRCKCMCYGCE